jgi:hypothetical protein
VSGDLAEDYATFSVSAGPERGQHILDLVCAQSELFWPLTVYLTEAPYAKELVQHLRLPSGKLPDSFEVVVKAQFPAGADPIHIRYVTHRVLSDRP